MIHPINIKKRLIFDIKELTTERDQLRSLEEAHLLTIRELASRLESYYKEMDSLEAKLTKVKGALGRAEAELEYDIGDSKSLQRGMRKVRKIITEALTELDKS